MQAVGSSDLKKKLDQELQEDGNLIKQILREVLTKEISEKSTKTPSPAVISGILTAIDLYQLSAELKSILLDISRLEEELSEINENEKQFEVKRKIKMLKKKFAVRIVSGVFSTIGSASGAFFCSLYVPVLGPYVCGKIGHNFGFVVGHLLGAAFYELFLEQHTSDLDHRLCIEKGLRCT